MKTSSLRAMIANRLRRKSLYCRADYWDAKAADYDEQSASWWPNGILTSLQRQELRRVLDTWLENVAELRVLDLGCGTGTISRYLAARGAVVHGVDFSAAAIKVAEQQNAVDAGDSITYEVGSLHNLETHQLFDVIITVGVLTIACRTGQELDQALQRIKSSVVPGGRILLIEPVHQGPLHRVLRMGRRQFLTHVTAAGLEVEAQEPLCCWPARLLVGYVRLPGWITRPVYWIGDVIMRTCRMRWLGDYLAIRVVRPPNHS